MNDLLVLSSPRERIDFDDAPYVEFEEIIPSNPITFLEANTNAIMLDELVNKCIVPCFASQELTISHQDFIKAVHEAASDAFRGEDISQPQIRVSHEVKGRIPSALHKPVHELLPSDKTRFYQRLAFAFTIPSISANVNGKDMQLCCGGVRNYKDTKLFSTTRTMESFSVFIGWRVNLCSNQVLTGDGVRLNMEVSNVSEIYCKVLEMFSRFDPYRELHLMQELTNVTINESQFAQIVGKMRLYEALPFSEKKHIPRLLITDSQINSVCRQFYNSPDFGQRNNAISLWDLHNMFTQSNKESSYIDNYIQRAVNATQVAVGLAHTLQGNSRDYAWFLE